MLPVAGWRDKPWLRSHACIIMVHVLDHVAGPGVARSREVPNIVRPHYLHLPKHASEKLRTASTQEGAEDG